MAKNASACVADEEVFVNNEAYLGWKACERGRLVSLRAS